MHLRFILGHAALLCACASAPPAQYIVQAAPSTAPDTERGLYDIILQLARDPAAQAKLAPSARVIFHGEETTSEPLTDARSELSWVSEASSEETTVRCVAAELRCSIEQPGGETIFRFAHAGEGAERRVVLSEIESSEP